MGSRQEIGFEIKVLSNLIKRKIDESLLDIGVDGLTGMHGMIIGYLYKNAQIKDVYQRDIENEFNIRRSTVTGVLQLMERNGLITREHVGHDARLKKIQLTPKAITVHNIISEKIIGIENKLRNGLTEEELQHFFIIMQKIKDTLI